MSRIFQDGVRRILWVLAAGGLFAGCGKPATTPATTPVAQTPAPKLERGFAGVGTPIPRPDATSTPNLPTATSVEDVSTPQQINTDAEDAGNRAMRAEVLKRIDVMPNLASAEKDKLYVQVQRARAMGMVIVIPFASGARAVGPSTVAGIAKALALPQVEKFSGDPTVVFVVLGYADKKGDPKANGAISLQRAESVVDVLKNKARVGNLVRAVGMGGSEMFDSTALDKNRVVEVWAVLP